VFGFRADCRTIRRIRQAKATIKRAVGAFYALVAFFFGFGFGFFLAFDG
jgi:hypothetical protein